MTAANVHAHPCRDIALRVLDAHGLPGVLALAALLAEIGDHADNDAARLTIRIAFEAAEEYVAAVVGGVS